MAYWAIGVLVYAVHVPSSLGQDLTDRRGRQRRCAGLTDASFFDAHLFFSKPSAMPLEVRSDAVRRAQLEVICTYAGPIIEARFRRCSRLAIAFTSGQEDFEQARRIIEWVTDKPEERASLALLAERAAGRVLKECSAALMPLAEELERAGTITGEDADALISSALGRRRPVHGTPPDWLARMLRSCEAVGRRR